MTPTTEFAAIRDRYRDAKIAGLVGAAHFISHYYYYLLPPLFLLVKAEFDVSYVELGVALIGFQIVTAALQTPAGIVIDRISARGALIGALAVGGLAAIAAGLTPSFYVFIAMFVVLGIANTAYHPADYALMSNRVSPANMSKAYAAHIFAGYLGTAVTPACQIVLSQSFGWRGAFVISGLFGIAVALLLTLFGSVLSDDKTPAVKSDAKSGKADWNLLLSTPVLLNVAFFTLISMISGGITTYGLVAIQAQGHSLSVATTALTVNLALAAFGVLVGGFVSSWVARQDLLATGGLSVSALFAFLIGYLEPGATLLIAMMGLNGFFSGLITSARDLLVRAVTPPGAFGAVFGFVTTGFGVGGMIAPPLFGWMMDHGLPQYIFFGAAFFGFLSIPTVMFNATGIRASGKTI